MSTTQPTGLRKLDLNNGINMVSNPGFNATSTINGGIGQATLSNEDLNQRTLSFGQAMGNYGQTQNLLSQSMDSSQMSAHGAYSSPKHMNHQQQQPSMPSLLQKNQPQVANTRPQQFLTSYNNQGFNQHNHYGAQSTSSIMSSKGSEYFQTPSRMQATAAPFSYQPQVTSKPSQTGNLGNFQFDKTLYEDTILVRIKSHDREEFTQPLGIKVIIHAHPSSSQQQVLAIELTDEQNPYFYYSLECSESDFHILRQELSLKIDFQNFHEMFKAFLEECIRPNFPTDHSKYYCVLDVGHSNEAHFFIIQPTQYREIIQLNLKFKQANDEGLKKYLAGKLKEAKERADDFSIKFHNKQEEYVQLQQDFNMVYAENTVLKDETKKMQNTNTMQSDQQKAQLKIEEQKKINDLTQKMLAESAEQQARNDNEKREMMNKYEKDLKQLSDKYEKLLSDHNTLTENKRSLDVEYKDFQQAAKIKGIEQTQKIESLSHELCIVKNQLNALQEANKNLDSTKYTQEKSITEYTLKYQALHRELEDKEQIIQNLTSHLDTAKTQKQQMEEQIVILKEDINKKQKKLETAVENIKQAQAYITKMEGKNKQYKQKVKLGTAASKQYEQQLQQKQEIIDEQIKGLNEMKRDYDRKEAEVKDLKKATETLQEQLNVSRQTIESNSQTIMYLNNRLTEKGGLGSSNYNSLSKPPTSVTSSFKPSFTTVDQLSNMPQQRTTSSYERSPFRNISSTNNNNLQTPSSVSSLSSVNTSQMNNSQASINLRNQAAPLSKAPVPTTFAYTGPSTKVGNENQSSNIPTIQPQFVSKYTQQIYNQQTTLPSNPLPLDSTKTLGSTLQRQGSASSLSSATNSISSSYSAAVYQAQDYGQSLNTMSFHPYQTKYNPPQLNEMNLSKMNLVQQELPQTTESNTIGLYLEDAGNNETKMSNNEAFQLLLAKNSACDDDE